MLAHKMGCDTRTAIRRKQGAKKIGAISYEPRGRPERGDRSVVHKSWPLDALAAQRRGLTLAARGHRQGRRANRASAR
jgi:hypothetical protein